MYNDFYGFTCSPFENTLNSEFFFPSVVHREGLASVLYGVKQSKGLMLITGDIGAGKTQILYMLREMLKKEHDSRILEVSNPWIAADELIDLVAMDLGVDLETKQKRNQLFVQIKAKLSSLREAGSRYMVVIDEAQLLDNQTFEALRLLSNIEEEGNKLIQLVLVGQLELLGRLQDAVNRPLLQRVTLHSKLDYLNQEQTATYIRYRLDKAGCKASIFTPQALAALYAAAKGSPRMINQFCDSCLILGFSKRDKQIGEGVVETVVGDSPHTLLNRYEVIEVDDKAEAAPDLVDIEPQSSTQHQVMARPEGEPEKASTYSPINIPVPSAQPAPAQPGSSPALRWWFACAAVIVLAVAIVLAGSESVKDKPTAPLAVEQPSPSVQSVVEPQASQASEVAVSHSADYRDNFDYRGAAAERSLRVPGREGPSEGATRLRVGMDRATDGYDTERTGSSTDAFQGRVRVEFPFDSGSLATVVPARAGWSLSRLSREHYGTWTATIEDVVRAANPALVDFNKIKAGDEVRFPYLSRGDLLTEGGGGRLFLYYGSYAAKELADRDLKLLRQEGREVTVDVAKWGSRTIYRLYLGPHGGYEQARASLSSLKLPRFSKVFGRELSSL